VTDVQVSGLHFRRAVDSDLSAILKLCEVALHWPSDPRNEQLFRWKHLTNPFGPSPMWIATFGERIVGFRAMMRWRFKHRDGSTVRAVRAVDTATHPDFQRRGIFSTLNTLAIEALTSEGVGFVFNTPNAESLPGYVKQGWVDLGPVPLIARPAGLRGLVAMTSARAKAAKWSGELSVGVEPATVTSVAGAPFGEFTSDTNSDVARWRYSQGPVKYRALSEAGSGLIVRVRQRGRAREFVVAHSWGTEVILSKLLKQALDDSRASYALATAGVPGKSAMLPIPAVGPHLAVRALASAAPRMGDFGLSLGDVELF
jgi:hypothetical protein